MNETKLTTINDLKALAEALAAKYAKMRETKNDLIQAADMAAADDLPQDEREVAKTFLSETQRHLDILAYSINHALSACHQSGIVLDAYMQGVFSKDEAEKEIRRMWRADGDGQQ